MGDAAGQVPNDPLRDVRTRREHFRVAMMELERTVSAAAPGRVEKWRSDVDATLWALRQAIDVHIRATEETGGLFEQVRMQAPRLDVKIDRLLAEHAEIRQRIDALLEAVPVGEDEEAWVEQVREDVLELLRLLSRHRQRGADLLYEAYDVDLGPGD